MQAFVRWKLYARPIESDLESHCHGRTIEQWHRGEMSSRKLLTLTDGLPHDSWMVTQLRIDLEEAEAARKKRELRMIQGINLAELEGRV